MVFFGHTLPGKRESSLSVRETWARCLRGAIDNLNSYPFLVPVLKG